MLEAGLIEKPDFLINGAAGSCDPNSKIFEYISEKWHIPAVYLDVPYSHDRRSIDYYTEGYRRSSRHSRSSPATSSTRTASARSVS